MRKLLLFCLILSACVLEDSSQEHELLPVWKEINGGTFTFGSDEGRTEEGPGVDVSVKSFSISTTEVTNAQFKHFVDKTAYRTDAEKNNEGAVFTNHWEMVEGANWKHPTGPGSSIENSMNHPVVMVSYNDAKAYCAWVGGRLPTEIEWEYVSQMSYDPQEDMNIWTGTFPTFNDESDAYAQTAPVDAYSPDLLGLYHMRGNVWEWCEDVYNFEVHDKWMNKDTVPESYGGKVFDPNKETADTLRVIKGGSFLCHANNCTGFLPQARQSAAQQEAFFHIGFRVVRKE